MRRIPLVAMFTLSVATWAADKAQPLKLKAGLWEVTTVTTSSDLPVPATILDKLTPEQRARMEERISARKADPGRTTIKKLCVTRKQLEDGIPFRPDRKSCRRMAVTSSGSTVEMRIECVSRPQAGRSEETLEIEAIDSQTIRGFIRLTAKGGQGAESNTTFTARWIGPVCSRIR
jgi:hypothetical protein